MNCSRMGPTSHLVPNGSLAFAEDFNSDFTCNSPRLSPRQPRDNTQYLRAKVILLRPLIAAERRASDICNQKDAR